MNLTLTIPDTLDQARATAWPLWVAVAEAMPEIVLTPLPPPAQRRYPIRSEDLHARSDWAAYRTVVELSDALHALSGLGAGSPARTCRLHPELTEREVAAAIAAEVLAEGLHARRTGGLRRTHVHPHGERIIPAAPRGADLLEELRWWGTVTVEYHRRIRHTAAGRGGYKTAA